MLTVKPALWVFYYVWKFQMQKYSAAWQAQETTYAKVAKWKNLKGSASRDFSPESSCQSAPQIGNEVSFHFQIR